jgi:hypothetical protein
MRWSPGVGIASVARRLGLRAENHTFGARLTVPRRLG